MPLLHDRAERRRHRSRCQEASRTSSKPAAPRKSIQATTFVHLNGGYQGGHGLEHIEPFVRAIKKEVGMLVGVQLTPERQLTRYDHLIDRGVDHFSFCVELVDPDWFARICPGKARTLGQDLFFAAMESCAARLPRGAVSGELIAGIEPIANTIGGIEHIVSAGAFPTVCIFRPTVGSDMADWPSPDYDEMRAVMGGDVQHLPPSPHAGRRRPEHRGEPGRHSGRCGAAGRAGRGVLRIEFWRRALRVAARPVVQAAPAAPAALRPVTVGG